jgi:hypothetical protein
MTDITFVPTAQLRGTARRTSDTGSETGSDIGSDIGSDTGIVFGRETVLVDTEPVATADSAARPQSLKAGAVLAAVIQKGRLFQAAHPDVPVLRDRGRFLLVALDPGHAVLNVSQDVPCFAVRPVRPGDMVFEEIETAALRRAPDPDVARIVEGLDPALFRSTLESLVAFHSRHSTTGFFQEAAALCEARLAEAGYTVRRQVFDMPGGTSANVVAMPPGGRPIRALVTAHLDSVNHAGGVDAPAPGADDNGSGSAGVVAMADALRPILDRLPVGFVLFGGEEQGLLGSRHFVGAMVRSDRLALDAIINMDMIGSVNVSPRCAAAGAERFARRSGDFTIPDRPPRGPGGQLDRSRRPDLAGSFRQRPRALHRGGFARCPDDRGRGSVQHQHPRAARRDRPHQRHIRAQHPANEHRHPGKPRRRTRQRTFRSNSACHVNALR